MEIMAEKLAALDNLVAAHENGAVFNEITAQTSAVSACHVVAVRIHQLVGKVIWLRKNPLMRNDRLFNI